MASMRERMKRALDGGDSSEPKRGPGHTPREDVTEDESVSNVFDTDARTERSMRDAGVSRRSEASGSAVALSLSATMSGQREHGVVRSRSISSIDLGDRASSTSEARPVPAPPPPVLPSLGVLPAGGCPICFEQFQSHYNGNRTMRTSVDAAAAGIQTTVRAAKANSAMQSNVTDLYQVVFKCEVILRGVIDDDDQLLRLILQLHQAIIEKPLKKRNIAYKPWDLLMLKQHFHPEKGHIHDEIRTKKKEKMRMINLMGVADSHLEEPDPDNPGQMKFNFQAAKVVIQASAHKVKLVESITKLIKAKEEDLPAAMFALRSQLARMTAADDEVVRDPRMAAGTMAVGGDTLRSANLSASTAIGSAQTMYRLSGF